MQKIQFANAPVQDEDVNLDEYVQLDENPDVAIEGAEKPGRIRRILILQTELAGSQFPLGPAQEPVTFKREPDFPGDRWTIRVNSRSGKMIGYLPFGANQSTARLIDAGRRITGNISDDAARIDVYLETEIRDDEEEQA